MVKRKLKTEETSGKVAKTVSCNDPMEEQRKEKLVPFDFEENDCDVVIRTKDKEIHVPSSFLVSNESNSNSTVKHCDRKMVDYSSVKVMKAFSFYYPKYWTDSIKCKSLYCFKRAKIKKSIQSRGMEDPRKPRKQGIFQLYQLKYFSF